MDAKRVLTKEILMRIELKRIAETLGENYIENNKIDIERETGIKADMSLWAGFQELLQKGNENSVNLFDI
jgi:hypothetical protein